MKDTLLFSSSELTAASFKELLPDFFTEIREDFNLLKNAFLNKKLEETKRLAHKIKGCASSYAAALINEKAFYLQAALVTETLDDDEINGIIHEFEEAINRTHEYAREHFQID